MEDPKNMAFDPRASQSRQPAPVAGPLRVSLATLDADEVFVAWNEAIAIVQEFCRAVAERPSCGVFDAREIFVTAAGTIAVESIGMAGPEALIRSIGELLGSCLGETPYPMPLRVVVADALETPPAYRTLTEMSKVLERFERGTRSDLIRAVFHRWRTPEGTEQEEDTPVTSPSGWARLRAIASSPSAAGGGFRSMYKAWWTSSPASVPPSHSEATAEPAGEPFLDDFDSESEARHIPADIPASRMSKAFDQVELQSLRDHVAAASLPPQSETTTSRTETIEAFEPVETPAPVKPSPRLSFLERVATGTPPAPRTPPIDDARAHVSDVPAPTSLQSAAPSRQSAVPAERSGMTSLLLSETSTDTSFLQNRDAIGRGQSLQRTVAYLVSSITRQIPWRRYSWAIRPALAGLAGGVIAIVVLTYLGSSRAARSESASRLAPQTEQAMGPLSSTLSRVLDWMGTRYAHTLPGGPSQGLAQSSVVAAPAPANITAGVATNAVTNIPTTARAASVTTAPPNPVQAVRRSSGSPAASSAAAPNDLQRMPLLERMLPPSSPPAKAQAASIETAPSAGSNTAARATVQTPETQTPRDRPIVYSAADSDVIPPAPIDRQVLSAAPAGLSDSDAIVVEIIVNENGGVESARLIKTPVTIRETMLATMNLAATKTWAFRPAIREGHPVKYRRRVWLPVL